MIDVRVYNGMGHLGYSPYKIPREIFEIIRNDTECKSFCDKGIYVKHYVRRPGVPDLKRVKLGDQEFKIVFQL